MKTKSTIRGEECVIYDYFPTCNGLYCLVYFPKLNIHAAAYPIEMIDLEAVNE